MGAAPLARQQIYRISFFIAGGAASWAPGWHLCVRVMTRMLASVFSLHMVFPVGIEAAVGGQCAELQHGLGASNAPAGARLVHAVADEIAARAFDHAGRNLQQPCRQHIGVPHDVAVLDQIVGADVNGLELDPLASGCLDRVRSGGASAPAELGADDGAHGGGVVQFEVVGLVRGA